MRHLLDVNVLVALFDPWHVQHEAAHRWFGDKGMRSWATCPITENGFVRVVSHPKYPNLDATPADALRRLRELCASAGHAFWPDDVSLRLAKQLDWQLLQGPAQLTDAYLALLALKHKGTLATFDRHLTESPWAAAFRSSVELVGE